MNYAHNLVNPAFSVLYHANGASEATAYDNFGRLQAVRRGTLSASGSNGTTLDTVVAVTDPTHGSNPIYGSQEWTLDQLGNWTDVESDTSTDTRTHNAQNELTADSAGALGYDNNGNLTTQAGYAANTYDAWNRATTIRGVTYAYDALGRRIWESANGGRAFFYDGQRMIETRTGPINALSSSAHEQYVYGQGYIDDVILRDAEVNGGGNLGINGSGLDQRIYYQQDREYNVVAITDQSGNVVERYAYDPYGSQSALDANWNLLSDGSAYGNQIGFTGRWLDSTGMWYFRARYLEPVLGRFINRDPSEFVNGYNLYNAYFVPNGTDETGEEANWHHYLPQAFRAFFEAAGLDIDSAEFGLVIDAEFHTGKDGLHALGWNNDWQVWIDKHKNATAAQIRAQLAHMKGSAKYAGLIAKGVQATLRYSAWKTLLQTLRIKEVQRMAGKLTGRVTKKIPVLGIAFVFVDIKHKGLLGGLANNLLDQVPWLGWGKAGAECIGGDWIPDIDPGANMPDTVPDPTAPPFQPMSGNIP